MIDGLVIVDKAEGWTSHDVVARCRRVFAQKRVGHAGTLDPDATGVLLVGLGRVTRLLRFLTALPKSYTCEVVLGVATSTLDAGGAVTGTWDMADASLDDVRAAAGRMLGRIEQVPPMVSAVKVGGERLHELARRGVEVERPSRSVVVHRLEVRPTESGGVFRMVVECSSGTYVRVLGADLGRALGGGAHIRGLRRTAIGSFSVSEATPLEALTSAAVLSPARAMRDYPTVSAGAEAATSIAHGRVVDKDAVAASGPGPWAVLDAAGDLLAVYEDGGDGRLKPVVVLPPA